MIADDIRTKTRHDPTGKNGGYRFEVLPGAGDAKHEDAVGELHELARKHVGNITITVKNRHQMAAHTVNLKAKAQSVAAALKKLVTDAITASSGNFAIRVDDPRDPTYKLLLIVVDGSVGFYALSTNLTHQADMIVGRRDLKVFKDRTGLLAIAP